MTSLPSYPLKRRHGRSPDKSFCLDQKIKIPEARGRKEKGERRTIEQLKRLCEQKEERQLYKQGLTKMSLRKSRTLTLIQLGGLVNKAGLLDPLNLRLGDNLQKDEQNFDAVATLMGAFGELLSMLEKDEAQKMLWRERGKKALAS